MTSLIVALAVGAVFEVGAVECVSIPGPSVNWVDTQNAEASDNRRAWARVSASFPQSDWMLCQMGAFDVPSGAVCDGFAVEIEGRRYGAGTVGAAVMLEVPGGGVAPGACESGTWPNSTGDSIIPAPPSGLSTFGVSLCNADPELSQCSGGFGDFNINSAAPWSVYVRALHLGGAATSCQVDEVRLLTECY